MSPPSEGRALYATLIAADATPVRLGALPTKLSDRMLPVYRSACRDRSLLLSSAVGTHLLELP